MSDSFFEFDRDAYFATEATHGPWDPGAQHAGPRAALIGREIERLGGGKIGGGEGAPAQIGRITYRGIEKTNKQSTGAFGEGPWDTERAGDGTCPRRVNVMSTSRDKHGRAGRRGLVALMLAIVALLGLSSTAQAGPDTLKGGSVVIQLQGSRGLKLTPSSLNLPITAGAVDPVSGSGTVKVSGNFKARRGEGKTKVTITALNLGADGGQGSISAKIGKKGVGAFGTLSGGTVARADWGATISNLGATITGKGAQTLNRALSSKKGEGAKKSAGSGVKAGQPLGTVVSVTTVPLAVEVVPGTGTLTLRTDLTGAFANKLPQHCISLVSGVTAIPPASAQLLNPANVDFPVSGGSAAPDFSAGELLTAGGQTLTKDNGPLTPGACSSSQPPVGTKLVSTNIGVDFAHNSLNSTAALPTGASLRAPLANIDFSAGTRSVDPNTKTLTVTNATVSLSFPAALTLNQFFPSVSGSSNDFAAGDAIGHIDISGAKLR